MQQALDHAVATLSHPASSKSVQEIAENIFARGERGAARPRGAAGDGAYRASAQGMMDRLSDYILTSTINAQEASQDRSSPGRRSALPVEGICRRERRAHANLEAPEEAAPLSVPHSDLGQEQEEGFLISATGADS